MWGKGPPFVLLLSECNDAVSRWAYLPIAACSDRASPMTRRYQNAGNRECMMAECRWRDVGVGVGVNVRKWLLASRKRKRNSDGEDGVRSREGQ